MVAVTKPSMQTPDYYALTKQFKQALREIKENFKFLKSEMKLAKNAPGI